jgi:hypothetical protein
MAEKIPEKKDIVVKKPEIPIADKPPLPPKKPKIEINPAEYTETKNEDIDLTFIEAIRIVITRTTSATIVAWIIAYMIELFTKVSIDTQTFAAISCFLGVIFNVKDWNYRSISAQFNRLKETQILMRNGWSFEDARMAIKKAENDVKTLFTKFVPKKK